VATASADGLLVRLWDAATGRARDTLRQPDLHPVDTLLSRDAVWLVTRDMDNTLRLWDVAAGRERAVMNDMRARVPTLLTPDGRLLTYQLPHALVWEMESGALAGRVDGVSLMTASVRDDGAVLLAGARAGSGDGRIFVYDLSSAHRPSVSFTGAAAAFSPDGTALAAIVPRKGSKPSEMWLWESAGWSRRVAWRGAGVWLWYSPDGEHIALLDAVGALRVLAVGS
jgi:WD40 repeat protein